MEQEYQNPFEEYIPIGTSGVPMDTIEVLRLGGDTLIVEACMRHFMREFEIGQGPDEWMEGGATI